MKNTLGNTLRTKLLVKKYNWDNIEPVFITSTGRTGTMFFSDFFSEYFSGTQALHEPWPDLHDIGYNLHHNKYSRQKVVDIISRERIDICKDAHKMGHKYYVESNYNLSYILPYLKDVFGSFKLIHVIREPKSYLRSIYSIKEAKRHIYAEFDNRPRITAKDFDGKYASEWDSWSRFEKLCWHYYKVNTLIGDHIAENGNGITVHFKDIFKKENNFKGLYEIADFSGIPLKENITKTDLIQSLSNRANKTKKIGLDSYDDWSADKKSIFHEMTDPIVQRFSL